MTSVDVETPSRTAPEESSLSPDQAFELLANERRRAVVAHLLDARHEVAVEDLADALADGRTPPDRIAATLHHAHLPKLAAAGVIEWDRGEYVEATPLLADLEPFLRVVADLEGRLG